MQKSYNPFKMWGSWVGFVLGFFSIMFMGPEGVPLNQFLWVYTNTAAIIHPLFGFLVGWGIHLLVIKLKR